MIDNKEYLSKIFLNDLKEYYNTFSKNKITNYNKFNSTLINVYEQYLYKNIVVDAISFIERNNYLKNIINKNYDKFFIYKQPTIILIYFLINTEESIVKNLWFESYEELEYLYTDLGISFDCNIQ